MRSYRFAPLALAAAAATLAVAGAATKTPEQVADDAPAPDRLTVAEASGLSVNGVRIPRVVEGAGAKAVARYVERHSLHALAPAPAPEAAAAKQLPAPVPAPALANPGFTTALPAPAASADPAPETAPAAASEPGAAKRPR